MLQMPFEKIVANLAHPEKVQNVKKNAILQKALGVNGQG